MGFYNFYLNEDNKFMIFCDMDGVICSFEKQYNNYSKISIEKMKEKYGSDSDEFWKSVNDAGVEFWSEMPWMSDGKQLWNFIKPHNPIILSSPANGEACPKGKKLWIQRELGDDVKYILEKNKYKYSGVNKILIDDSEDKILPWIESGGIGILHTSTDDTIKQLKDIMK